MVESKQQWKAWLYLAPAIVLLLIFTVWPIINTVAMAFMEDYSGLAKIGGDASFHFGFGNFVKVAQNAEFKQALTNTILLCLITVPVSTVLALLIAVAFGFVVNKIYVFRSLDWSAKVAFRECWQFVAARLFSGVLETAMLKVFVDWLGMNDAIVKIFSNIVVVIVNYVLSKLVIFRKKQVLLEKLEQASASCAKQAAALPAAEEPVQAQGAIAGRKRRRRRADGASPMQGASAAKAQGKAKPKGRAKGGAKGRRTRRKGRR